MYLILFFFFSEIYLNFSFAHATWRLLSTKCDQNFCCCCLVKRKHSVEFAKKRLENLQKNARHGWKSLIEELVRIAKGVINQTASSRVMTFSTGFCPGCWCAYFVYITSCITQKGISSALHRREFLAHHAKNWERGVFMKQPKQENFLWVKTRESSHQRN